MTGLPQNEFQENFEVNKIRNSMLTAEAKRSRIQELKKSFHESPKNSSFKTIFNLSNCMVGSSIVVFPLIFSTSGVITSLLVLAFMGIITCKTCLLQIVHFKVLELDFPDVVKRVMGKKWSFAYCFCSSLLLFITGVIYFMLICNMLYMVIGFFMRRNGMEVASKDDLVFDRFSYQYTGIIMIFFCYIMFYLKDLTVILKIGQYGIISIFTFIIYIITKGSENMSNGNITSDNIKILTPDFATLCGVFSLSFMCHNVIIPVIRNNHDESKNQRDIVLGYIMTGSIYLIIGIFGCFAIAGLNPENKRYDTVLEYFSDDIFTVVIEILLFMQLLSVVPILWYVCRSQFFNLIYGNDEIPFKYYVLANTVFAIVSLIVQMLNVNPTLIISLNGGVIGYLLVYTVPIKLHLTCLYKDNVALEERKEPLPAIKEVNEVSDNSTPLIHKDKESTFVNTLISDGITIENYSPNELKSRQGSDSQKGGIACRSAHLERKGKIPKKVRYAFYTTIMLIGLAFAIIKIVGVIMGN